MAERKVLNKYFPPDFDPTQLAPKTPWKEQKVVVRMMLPMNVQCKTCKEYMYRGTKFNTRKEDVEGETYLGIRLYRFYFKCTGCSQPFCLKTDPENADYTCETGVSRNFEPWKARQKDEADWKQRREDEEHGDAMKALENRTEESKREIDFLDALSEMREKNKKLAAAEVDMDAVLRTVAERHKAKEKKLTETEKDEVQKAFLEAAKAKQRALDEQMLKEREQAANLSSWDTPTLNGASSSFSSSTSSLLSSSTQTSKLTGEDRLLSLSNSVPKAPSTALPQFTISFLPEEPSKKKHKKKKHKHKKRKKKDKEKGKESEKGESSGTSNDANSAKVSKKQKLENGTAKPQKEAANPLALIADYSSGSDSD